MFPGSAFNAFLILPTRFSLLLAVLHLKTVHDQRTLALVKASTALSEKAGSFGFIRRMSAARAPEAVADSTEAPADLESCERLVHNPCLPPSDARRSRGWPILLATVSAVCTVLWLCYDPSLDVATLAVARRAPWVGDGTPADPFGAPGRPAATPLLRVHQTVHDSLGLSASEQAWSDSWRRLGFEVRTADDAQVRDDVRRLVRETGRADFLRVFDGLETSVQRSDVWRYAILYLEGGVYADIDVVAHAPIVELLLADTARPLVFTESLPLFDWLPHAVSGRAGALALAFGLTDLVRLPQRRNCLMAAPRHDRLMLRTLELVVDRFDAMHARGAGKPLPPEPTRTLELTGPGVYTDAVQLERDVTSASASRALGGARLRFVSRLEGLRFFEHVAQGSWKTYLDDVATHGGAKPHELRLRRLLMLLMVLGLLANWGWPYLVQPKPREQLQACCRSDRTRWTELALAAARRGWLKLGVLVPAVPVAHKRWRRWRRPSHDIAV